MFIESWIKPNQITLTPMLNLYIERKEMKKVNGSFKIFNEMKLSN